MGWGVDFGPPKTDGFNPHGDWQGERKLSKDALAELVRLVESWGHSVSSHGEHRIVDVPCEEFMFHAGGGYLSKPGAGSDRDRDDEVETQLSIAERICDFAGWVIIGEGYTYGFSEVVSGYEVHTSPPEARESQAPSLLAKLAAASTASALTEALADLQAAGEEVPMGDPAVLFALLVSHDENAVADALHRLDVLDPAPQRTDLRQARLRRVALLSGDPEVSARAKALSTRLR